MSKISQYLNEHLLGEVICSDAAREHFATDGSILAVKPELAVAPRITNDIRKVARFTWQLAEKGHSMPITVRGGGTDQTGAAINNGIIINALPHLNNIIYINSKDKDQFVHVQPGITFGALNEALKSQGVFIPSYPTSSAYSTIGGAIANNASGPMSGQFSQTGDFVSRLEVVLANGDLMETGRISRNELNKKKGLQTLEGEIYRKIDGIIEDNEQLIKDKISTKPTENVGYTGIAKVKNRDGSFDLTPLFIGSQGTLGIISEIVIKTVFYSNEESIIVSSFDDAGAARDCANSLAGLKPAILEIIDNGLFEIAETHGKRFIFNQSKSGIGTKSILYISFNDFGNKARQRKMNRALKMLTKVNAITFTCNEYPKEELQAVREVSSTVILSGTKDQSFPSIIDGSSIPLDKREEFISSVSKLELKHHIKLPLQFNWLNGVVHTRTALNLHTIVDKQKIFKLMSDYADIVNKHNGCLCFESSEGRLKSVVAYSHMDKKIIEIYDQIKLAFDPFNTLNPGIKQSTDIKTIVSQLNSSASLVDFIKYSPLN